MNNRFNRFSNPNPNPTQPNSPNTAPTERPVYNPTPAQPPQPAQEIPPSVFVPEIEYKPVSAPTVDPSADGSLHNASGTESGFYGSYGAICNDSMPKPAPNPGLSPEPDFKPVYSTDFPSAADKNPWDLPSATIDEDAPFNPILIGDDDNNDDDDLMPPIISDYSMDNVSDKKKSLEYEATTKIESAASSVHKEKPIFEAIPESFKEMVMPPKVVKFNAVASGTVTGKDDLPKLKEGQMYVALTHKQLRRLRGRSFRGLGIICTLCLVIISAFCIWNYVNSFTDPIVGRWKGDLASQSIPIESLKQMGDIFTSTWEFSENGTMYLNLVINDTPVSLGGSYKQQKDEKGEQYLSMTLKNPMDGVDYTFNMYYTITGKVLVLNDMQGLGMSIDLIRE